MKYLALVSGGKDSIYSIHRLQRDGHQLAGLLYMKSSGEYQDSYMYQTVGSEIVQLLGECLDVPIFVHETGCRSINQDLTYKEEDGDEVEDLYIAVRRIRECLDFQGVSSGAILSRYQKNRVEHICRRMDLCSLAPLWERPQKELLAEMVSEGIEARIVKVASSCLGKECLNMGLREVYEHLEKNSGSDPNFCGEGGEYESIVVDCPMFRKRIRIDEYEICGHPEETDREGTVFYMRILQHALEEK